MAYKLTADEQNDGRRAGWQVQARSLTLAFDDLIVKVYRTGTTRAKWKVLYGRTALIEGKALSLGEARLQGATAASAVRYRYNESIVRVADA